MSDACQDILTSLPEWFGIPVANEAYIDSLGRLTTFVAEIGGNAVGFVALALDPPESAEIHVLAVRRDYHRRGVGRELVLHSERWLRSHGVRTLSVKTLSSSDPSPHYAATRVFYEDMGFDTLFETTAPWGPENPALVLVKSL